MNKIQNYEWMLCGSHYLSSVAAAYFPNYRYNNKAKERFRNEIEQNAKLWEALKEKDYTRETLTLTPILIFIIICYWGMPDLVRQELEKQPELRKPKMNRN